MAESRVELGLALQRRAVEVGEQVVTSGRVAGRAYYRTSEPAADKEDRVRETCALATQLVGRYLAGGGTPTAEETESLAATGRLPADGDVLLVDVTKSYFAWRDTACAVVDEEAARLQLPAALVAEAKQIVTMSCDASLIQMVRHFDRVRRRLQQRIDAEHAEMAQLALHDPLTGLANRTLLLDRISHALADASRGAHQVGVLFCDLDGFKAVNDALGHAAGDELLRTVARRFAELVRPGDTVARLGGDEFVVVCPDLSGGEQEAGRVADRLHAGLRATLSAAGLAVSASIGIAMAAGGDDPERLLARADTAMYNAKRQRGRR